MIHFMLDDLGCPTGVFAMLFSEITVQIIYFDLLVSRAGSHTFQRQPSSVWYGRSFLVITGLIMAN